jgi:hypothetical protein
MFRYTRKIQESAEVDPGIQMQAELLFESKLEKQTGLRF